MDMQPAARLADGDLRGERNAHTVFIGQRADDPLRDEQLVGGRLKVRGQELDLVLLVHPLALREVAHLRMAVLDLAAGLRDVLHGTGAEVRPLVEGGRFVVAPLIDRREELLARSDDVELQLAHDVEVEARRAAQRLVRPAQRLLGSQIERRAVLRVVAAEDVHGGNLAEGVAESRAVTRHDIEVARTRLDVGEEARTVNPLAAGEDALQAGTVVDDEVERLQPAVGARIAQVDHLDIVLLDIADQVRTGKFPPGLSQKAHKRIGIQSCVHAGFEV